MNRTALLVVLVAIGFLGARPSAAQDVMAEHRVAALKALPEVAIVYRRNVTYEPMPFKELTDMVRVGLARHVPSLAVNEKADATLPWLHVDLISSEGAATLTLTLYRWVLIRGPAESTFSPVWTDTRLIVGHPNRDVLRVSLDSLLTAFGADYLRAKSAGAAKPK